MYTLFVVITTVFGYLALFCSALCIACGLYCAAEVAEEYSALSKKLLKYLLLVVFSFHLLFLLAGVNFFTIAVSTACHLVYSCLLTSFPFVDPLSVPAIASIIAVGVAHYVWFQYFYANFTPIFQVTGFFLVMIWAVPLGFFVSLSMGDDALPVGSQGQRVGSSGQPKTNVFKYLFDAAADKYNNFIKKQSPGLGKHS